MCCLRIQNWTKHDLALNIVEYGVLIVIIVCDFKHNCTDYTLDAGQMNVIVVSINLKKTAFVCLWLSVCVRVHFITHLEIRTSKVICFDIFTNAFKRRNWFGLWKCITLQITWLFGPYLSNQFCIQHPELLRNVSLRFKSILTLSGQMILMLA